jgi:hypothetical protein
LLLVNPLPELYRLAKQLADWDWPYETGRNDKDLEKAEVSA